MNDSNTGNSVGNMQESGMESFIVEWSNIHNKCIFDAINDALDYYRPHGLRGPPLIWSNLPREITNRNTLISNLENVLAGVKNKVRKIYINNIGDDMGRNKCWDAEIIRGDKSAEYLGKYR